MLLQNQVLTRWKKTAEDMRLDIVTIETFQKGQSDYNAQLTKIKELKPDLILASALI